jgi:hypothetical protein
MIAPNKDSKQAKSKSAPRNGRARVVLWGGAVSVVVAVAVVLWMTQSEETEVVVDELAGKPGQIAEVAPAKVSPITEAPAKPKPYKEMSREEKLKSIRDKYGDNIPDNLKPVVYYLENPPQQTFHPARTKFPYLKRRSEREIASVLDVEPGTWMMGKAVFGDKFDKDLAAAIEEPIEFEKDDTDEIRTVKQAVIETKKELAERIKNGEVASDIMNATISELYSLGQYKRDLEEQVGAIRRNAEYTDQDVEDVVNAANQMLQDKGLPPMRMPNMLIRRASLRKAAEKAARENQIN